MGHAECAGYIYEVTLEGAEPGASQSNTKLGARTEAEVVAAAAAP